MEILLQDLSPGQEYVFQLRSKNQNGVSQWSRAYSFTTNSDTTAPSSATGLTWVDTGTSFVGEWTAPTTDSDGGDLRDFKDFKVTLTADAVDVVFYVTEPRFDLSLSRNISSWNTPEPSVDIKVEVRDTAGNLSTPVTASATNPIPSDITGFDATSALGGVNLVWDHVADDDLKQYEVYVGGSSGFTPGPSNLKIVTTANSAFYATDVLTLQYFKIRAVDAFNQGSLNYVVESQIAYPLDGVPDSVAPSQPSAPTVSTGILVAQVSHDMTKQAGGNLESDVDYLEIHASTSTGFTPDATTLRGTIDSAGPGIAVSAAFFFPTTDSMTNLYWKVIAVDRSKNKSSASNQATGLPNLIENANILNATITDAKVQNLSAAKLIAGTAIINDLFIESNITVSDVGVIESENFVAGASGWQITAAGTAEFNSIAVRGNLHSVGPTFTVAIEDGVIKIYRNADVDEVTVWATSGLSFAPADATPSLKLQYWDPDAIGFRQIALGDGEGVYFDRSTKFWVKGKAGGDYIPEVWTNVTFQNGWTNWGGPYATVQYRLDANGWVNLQGVAAPGTTTTGTVVFTLPAGYRPSAIHQFHPYGAANYLFEVQPDGECNISGHPGGGAALSISGFRFPVA